MGISVVKVSKVPDNLEKISKEVKKFSKNYDYVLTTGGVGPTHDDVTYEAVAKAFDDHLILDPYFSKLVFEFYRVTDVNHPAFKMARIPSKAKLVHGIDPESNKKSMVPCVSVENVFIFPGVAQYSKIIFESTKTRLFSKVGKFYHDNIYLKCSEGDIVDTLNSAVAAYPSVVFGCYPNFFNIYYKVKISMEAVSNEDLQQAISFMRKRIVPGNLIDFDENPFENKKAKFEKLNYGVFKKTFEFLQDLLQKIPKKYIFLYFDGGKNSTALLHMLSILFEKDERINCIYVEVNTNITNFVFSVRKYYNINLLKIDEDNFLNFAGCNNSITLIKGTRDSDPDAKKIHKYFKEFEVVNPINHWRYADVWTLIRKLCLPYCDLYDKGFSSITKKYNAMNPHLMTDDPLKYKKSFELPDDSLENAS